MKKYILIITFFCSLNLLAQDIHFSQYYNTPLITNPALTGVFGGDQRAIIIYRNQWASVSSPYSTYGASFDMRMLDKKNGNFSLGTGLQVYKDVAGDTKFGATNVGLSLSGIIKMTDYQHLTIGVQGGFDQRSINNSSLIWDNQYTGSTYDPALSSNETNDYNQGISNGDLNTGVAWVYSSSANSITQNDVFSIKLGMIYSHITKPSLNYGTYTENLHNKIGFNGDANISVKNTNYGFRPSFLYQKQGPAQEILIGTIIRYKMGFNSKYTGLLQQSALLIGVHSRIGDAIIPSIGYEIANWKLMFSYDANISNLANASNGVGGFEVTLIFINPNPFTYGKTNSARFN